MIKCFHITVTEVREGSCFCDVPAALYSVFKNCYMNITDMHLLNVSAGIGTLNPMLFEPEKYTKHSRGVIQPELHVQHHRLYLKDCPTRLHKQWRDTCSHSLCSQHKPQKADWEWCAQLSHNTFSETEKSSPSTIHTHTCTPTHTHTEFSCLLCGYPGFSSGAWLVHLKSVTVLRFASWLHKPWLYTPLESLCV